MEEVGVTEVVSSIAANSLEALMGILIKLGLSLLVFVIAKLVISLIRRFFNKVSNKEPSKLTPLMAGFVVKVLAVRFPGVRFGTVIEYVVFYLEANSYDAAEFFHDPGHVRIGFFGGDAA